MTGQRYENYLMKKVFCIFLTFKLLKNMYFNKFVYAYMAKHPLMTADSHGTPVKVVSVTT